MIANEDSLRVRLWLVSKATATGTTLVADLRRIVREELRTEADRQALARRRTAFRQGDLARVIKAVIVTDLMPRRIEITPTGSIVVDTEAPQKETTSVEAAFLERRARVRR